MKRFVAIIGLLAVMAPFASAQDVRTEECGQQVYKELQKAERTYRSVLFGQKKAADAEVGSVRFDSEGTAWIKKSANTWRTLATGRENERGTDDEMDKAADTPVRRGLFEIKTASTSELIPPLTQSLRALQCKLRSVCARAQLPYDEKNKKAEDILVDGCITEKQEPFSMCKDGVQANIGSNTCDQAIEGIMDREIQLLKTVVAYDAAYRTLMQFAGNFDGFLSEFRFPLIEPVWQMVRAAGQFTGLTCFSPQCDE